MVYVIFTYKQKLTIPGVMLGVLFAMALAISNIEGHFTADSCSISCPGQEITSTNLRQKYIGPPGKRGAIGRAGPSGPIGRTGSKGEQGESCNCSPFEDKIISLNSTVERLKSKLLFDVIEPRYLHHRLIA